VRWHDVGDRTDERPIAAREWAGALVVVVAMLALLAVSIAWLVVPSLFSCGCTQPPPAP
jgi:uncharacterized RDD family membrane protein YckC